MNAASDVPVKTEPSAGSGNDFRSALTSATAKETGSRGANQLKNRPETSDARKKIAASASDPTSPAISVTSQAQPLEPIHFAIVQTTPNEAAGQAPVPAAGDAEVGGASIPPTELTPALQTSRLPITELSSNALPSLAAGQASFNIGREGVKVFADASIVPIDGATQNEAAPSEDALALATTEPQAVVLSPPLAVAEATISAQAKASALEMATPIAGTATNPSLTQRTNAPALDATAADHGAVANKASETSSSVPSLGPGSANGASDSVTSAGQQAVIAQSVSEPIRLPSLPSLNTDKSATMIETSTARSGSPVVDGVKGGGSSRQMSSSAKGKPPAGSADLQSKFSNSMKDTDASSVPVPAVAKVTEAVVGVGQGGSVAKSAPDVSGLQQIAQFTPGNGPSQAVHDIQGTGGTSQPTFVATSPHTPMAGPAPQEISSAQLIQSMRSSEMKLGMQSVEFGNISISTSLSHQLISAQISIDHLELGKALAVHLPAIEEKLGSAYGVQARVELRDSNHTASLNGSGYSNSGQQSRQHRQSQSDGSTSVARVAFEQISSTTNYTTASTTAGTSRLDVRI